MSRPSKTEQELGHIKDLWTELRTLEAEYHGLSSIHMVPLARPGCFSVRITFTTLDSQYEEKPADQAIQFAFPNVEQSTFAGMLWRKAISLGRMIMQADEASAIGQKKRS